MADKMEECRGKSISMPQKTQHPTITPKSSISSRVFSEVLYLLNSKNPSLLLIKVYDVRRCSLRGVKKSEKE